MTDADAVGRRRPPLATEVEMQVVPEDPLLEERIVEDFQSFEVCLLLGILGRCADRLFPHAHDDDGVAPSKDG